jgi:hypothetical protein
LSSIAQAFTGFLKVIKDEFWPTVKGALIWVWDSLTSFIGSINWSSVWSGIVGVFTSLYDYANSIDWSGIGESISNLFSTIVGYVSNINWASVWSTVWSGLTAVGSFISENVFPIFTSFFNWLISWFTDSSKRQTLFNAINATWNFITEWASYIWQSISPYLASFFNWFSSWFTDSTKRQQLLNGITKTWDFITGWASAIWSTVQPYLSSFFGWFSSWFTDSSKRQQLWNGIVNTWNFVTTWASNLWNWVSPYLSQFFGWLFSWVVDPSKRTQLYEGIVKTWDVFSTWASNLWAWISPKLAEMYNNLIAWLNAQKPGLGTALDGWRQSFVDFAIKTKDAFNENLPQLSKATSEAATSISKDIGNMLWALKQLFTGINTDGATTVSDWAKLFTSLYTIISRVTSGVVKAVSTMVQSLSIMKQAINGMTSGNFDFSGLTGQLNQLISGMQGTIIEDIAKWIDPLYWMGLRPDQLTGHAKGGIVGSDMQLVGEKGPELAQFPKGTRIWDHGQSMGMLNQSQGQTLTIVIRNEGSMPTDRKTIDEIALQLQRRLSLQGNRFVLA